MSGRRKNIAETDQEEKKELGGSLAKKKLPTEECSGRNDCNGALSNAQFGFQKGKGINNAIFTFTEFILNSKDNKNQTVGLFLDLSKAFDTVDHMILIQKLQWFGIRGLAKSWFVSYLSARQQFVEIGSMKSYPTIMKSGVPQGSILGPILFLLYINDLPSRITQAKTILFADDTNIVFNALDKNNLQEKINETSRQLEQWLASNRLKLNVSKTVCMYFSQKQLHGSIEILLNNTGIKDVDCTKFLGIWIDSNLTWESHIQFLTDKLSRLCYAFRVLTNITPKELLRAKLNSLAKKTNNCKSYKDGNISDKIWRATAEKLSKTETAILRNGLTERSTAANVDSDPAVASTSANQQPENSEECPNEMSQSPKPLPPRKKKRRKNNQDK
ncbi:hypothetical protein ANN_04714 [Periplaneta americana]|uniref:Reverse transcriptase domain-containing protein n=1 Tax=Periplaneta americana TaxID=6978 RepID=A0ABQ8T983_PERAM|nr:hypothetical protein ANN_04714 [Periplaneta americana]